MYGEGGLGLNKSDRTFINMPTTSKLLVIILMLSFCLNAGCVREDDLTLEQRSFQLSKQIMCPVCDGQTIDQSQSQLSKDMKNTIIDKLNKGETNKEIRDFFVSRYGEEVLAAPSSKGINLIVWVAPIGIFIFGLLIVAHAYKNMRKQPE